MEEIIALFGESEKGQFHTPYYCQSIIDLCETLGNPPKESQGLFFAIQALFFNRSLLFFRVEEEGFSIEDYLKGIKQLQDVANMKKIKALCFPGVGSKEIIEATHPILYNHKSLLITTEKDFYDYLTL